MNVRRPQEIQHERQEAPAGPKVSARRLQEASQNELTQKPSGARELSGAARSRRQLSGAIRSQLLGIFEMVWGDYQILLLICQSLLYQM